MSEAAPERKRVTARDALALTALGFLYLVQGMPFGYQADVLPMVMRSQDASLTLITFSKLLAIPWSLKFLLGPFVDAYGSERVGRRKSFILPLQIALIGAMAMAAMLPVESSLPTLCAMIRLMNACAASMDVAVDGLAVDTLRPHIFGLGNAVQVDGFRLGMIIASGVLVQFISTLGLRGIFAAMAVITLFVHAITWLYPENQRAVPASREHPDVRHAISGAWATVKAKEGRAIVLFVLLYKAGEAFADPLFRPLLDDLGVRMEDVAWSVNTLGASAALVGPIFAGILVRFIGIERAILLLLFARIFPLVGELALAMGALPHDAILPVTLVEHFIGSAVTTVTFTLMMTVVDPRIGATHFTALATLENVGKGTLGFIAGPVGDLFGITSSFALGVLLTVAFALVGPVLARRALRARPA